MPSLGVNDNDVNVSHAVLQFNLDIGEDEHNATSLPRLREMTFNLATGEASSRQVADTVCDFPRVPLSLVGNLFWPLLLLPAALTLHAMPVTAVCWHAKEILLSLAQNSVLHQAW